MGSNGYRLKISFVKEGTSRRVCRELVGMGTDELVEWMEKYKEAEGLRVESCTPKVRQALEVRNYGRFFLKNFSGKFENFSKP